MGHLSRRRVFVDNDTFDAPKDCFGYRLVLDNTTDIAAITPQSIANCVSKAIHDMLIIGENKTSHNAVGFEQYDTFFG